MYIRHPRDWSIKTHLMALVVAFGLCMAAWIVHVHGALEQILIDRAKDEVRLLGEQIVERHQAISRETQQVLATLARTGAVQSLNPERLTELLTGVHQDLPQYATLVAASPQGFVYASSIPVDLPIDIRDRSWFKRVMATKSFVVDEFIVSKSAKTASLPFALPVLDPSGDVRVILGAALKLSFFAELFADVASRPGVRVFLLDHHHTILFAGQSPAEVVGRAADEVLPAPLAAASPGLFESAEGERETMLYVVEQVTIGQRDNRFSLLVGIPKADLLAKSRQQLAGHLSLLLAFVFMATLLLLWYGRRMVAHPLQVLIHATKAVSRGHLTTRTGLPYRATEFGALAREIDAMIVALESEEYQRQQQDKALKESEQRFRALVEHAADAIYLADMQGRLINVNIESERQTGYSREELLHQGITDIDAQETTETLAAFLREIPQRRMMTLETRHRRKDGSTYPVEVRVVYLQSEAQPMILGLSRDISARKQAEEALRESNELLSLFIRHSPIYAYIKEVTPTESRTLKASENFQDMIGMPAAAMIGKPMHELFPAEFAARITADDWSVISRGEILRLDEDFNGRNYTTIKFPITLGGKHLLAGYTIDITERKRAEQELIRKDALLRAMLRNLPFDFWARDTNQRIIMQSDESIQLWGDLAASAMPGQQPFHLQTLDLWQANNRRVLAGESVSGDCVLTVKSGEQRQFHSIVVPIREGDDILGILGTNIDITERKRTEEELRRREHQLQRILEILPIGLWFADKNGNLLRGNPMGVKIWGAEPTVAMSELGVFKAWRLPSREPVADDEWALVKTIRQGATIVDELLEIEAFDGKRKTILNYSAPLLDDNGQVDGAIVVNLDISDRMALENQLLQAQKMESIGRLAGGVAHDFNNMLSVILGHCELALKGIAADHPLFTRLQNIREAAERSADLTRQLLAFARQQTVAPKVLDLNETVAGMLKMLRRLIGEDIDLAWLPGRTVGSIRMDPSQLDQMLVNLCVNGRDAIGDTGKITIETAAATFDADDCATHTDCLPGDYALLAVSDNGCGMDEETLSHLFEPFFTTKEMGKGTGLGLATVYGIIRQNNGFINVSSEPGMGTTFRVYLPRHSFPEEISGQRPTEASPEGGRETILLVEDEPMNLEMTVAMLEHLGYTVIAASTPADAIRLAREHDGTLRLLMTDVVMPEMNGRELARTLCHHHAQLKLLFMSGYTANVIAHHGVLEEGVHFLQKPFSLHTLAAKVREALDTGEHQG